MIPRPIMFISVLAFVLPACSLLTLESEADIQAHVDATMAAIHAQTALPELSFPPIPTFTRVPIITTPMLLSPDRDGDGVVDSADSCPAQGNQGYGVDPSGCPLSPSDRDGDGVIDSADSCPSQGSQGSDVGYDGCPLPPPDKDGDGVTDSADSCPSQGNQGYGVDSSGCPLPPPIPDCPGALPTRVSVGMTIRVTTSTSNEVPKLGIRPQPTLDVHKMFELLSGEKMTVLDGPVCANESYFWHISSAKGDGWVREGNTEFYFVDPLP